MAMLFSAFSAFMGSVYFLEKRSTRSMITASVGALTNVVLNLLLIPSQGAMGAAIATVISYVAVFAIRAFDTGKYLKFDLCIPKVVLNTLIVTAQTIIMILEIPYWIIWQIAITAIIVILNGREILIAAKEFLSNFLKNKEKNI